MPDVSLAVTALLAGVAFLAGFIDAIAGGGGLLTLPALLLAGLPPHAALGTNKGQSVFGSGMALVRFSRSSLFDSTRAGQSFVPALFGSACGVLLVSRIPPGVLAPLVMVLLAVAAVVVASRRPPTAPRPRRQRPWWLAALVAAAIGGYDGFFGPGTGTFLILVYVFVWADAMDAASANAKLVNFGSNLAAAVIFGVQGLVLWKLAIPMGLGQAIGGFTGAHVTVRRGQGLVRFVVVAVSLALVARLAWQLAG